MEPPYGLIVVIKRNNQDGGAFPIMNQTTFIGRDANCHIRLRPLDVSKCHAAIEINASTGDAYITDKSSNGTGVNGKMISVKQLLLHQDLINIGDRKFRFEYSEDHRNGVQTPLAAEKENPQSVVNSALFKKSLDATIRKDNSDLKPTHSPQSKSIHTRRVLFETSASLTDTTKNALETLEPLQEIKPSISSDRHTSPSKKMSISHSKSFRVETPLPNEPLICSHKKNTRSASKGCSVLACNVNSLSPIATIESHKAYNANDSKEATGASGLEMGTDSVCPSTAFSQLQSKTPLQHQTDCSKSSLAVSCVKDALEKNAPTSINTAINASTESTVNFLKIKAVENKTKSTPQDVQRGFSKTLGVLKNDSMSPFISTGIQLPNRFTTTPQSSSRHTPSKKVGVNLATLAEHTHRSPCALATSSASTNNTTGLESPSIKAAINSSKRTLSGSPKTSGVSKTPKLAKFSDAALTARSSSLTTVFQINGLEASADSLTKGSSSTPSRLQSIPLRVQNMLSAKVNSPAKKSLCASPLARSISESSINVFNSPATGLTTSLFWRELDKFVATAKPNPHPKPIADISLFDDSSAMTENHSTQLPASVPIKPFIEQPECPAPVNDMLTPVKVRPSYIISNSAPFKHTFTTPPIVAKPVTASKSTTFGSKELANRFLFRNNLTQPKGCNETQTAASAMHAEILVGKNDAQVCSSPTVSANLSLVHNSPSDIAPKRGIRFGPPLNPEIFDSKHPPSTPIRRGEKVRAHHADFEVGSVLKSALKRKSLGRTGTELSSMLSSPLINNQQTDVSSLMDLSCNPLNLNSTDYNKSGSTPTQLDDVAISNTALESTENDCLLSVSPLCQVSSEKLHDLSTENTCMSTVADMSVVTQAPAESIAFDKSTLVFSSSFNSIEPDSLPFQSSSEVSTTSPVITEKQTTWIQTESVQGDEATISALPVLFDTVADNLDSTAVTDTLILSSPTVGKVENVNAISELVLQTDATVVQLDRPTTIYSSLHADSADISLADSLNGMLDDSVESNSNSIDRSDLDDLSESSVMLATHSDTWHNIDSITLDMVTETTPLSLEENVTLSVDAVQTSSPVMIRDIASTSLKPSESLNEQTSTDVDLKQDTAIDMHEYDKIEETLESKSYINNTEPVEQQNTATTEPLKMECVLTLDGIDQQPTEETWLLKTPTKESHTSTATTPDTHDLEILSTLKTEQNLDNSLNLLNTPTVSSFVEDVKTIEECADFADTLGNDAEQEVVLIKKMDTRTKDASCAEIQTSEFFSADVSAKIIDTVTIPIIPQVDDFVDNDQYTREVGKPSMVATLKPSNTKTKSRQKKATTTPDMRGLRKLMKTPKAQVDVDFDGLADILKTPVLADDSLVVNLNASCTPKHLHSTRTDVTPITASKSTPSTMLASFSKNVNSTTPAQNCQSLKKNLTAMSSIKSSSASQTNLETGTNGVTPIKSQQPNICDMSQARIPKMFQKMHGKTQKQPAEILYLGIRDLMRTPKKAASECQTNYNGLADIFATPHPCRVADIDLENTKSPLGFTVSAKSQQATMGLRTPDKANKYAGKPTSVLHSLDGKHKKTKGKACTLSSRAFHSASAKSFDAWPLGSKMVSTKVTKKMGNHTAADTGVTTTPTSTASLVQRMLSFTSTPKISTPTPKIATPNIASSDAVAVDTTVDVSKKGISLSTTPVNTSKQIKEFPRLSSRKTRRRARKLSQSFLTETISTTQKAPVLDCLSTNVSTTELVSRKTKQNAKTVLQDATAVSGDSNGSPEALVVIEKRKTKNNAKQSKDVTVEVKCSVEHTHAPFEVSTVSETTTAKVKRSTRHIQVADTFEQEPVRVKQRAVKHTRATSEIKDESSKTAIKTKQTRRGVPATLKYEDPIDTDNKTSSDSLTAPITETIEPNSEINLKPQLDDDAIVVKPISRKKKTAKKVLESTIETRHSLLVVNDTVDEVDKNATTKAKPRATRRGLNYTAPDTTTKEHVVKVENMIEQSVALDIPSVPKKRGRSAKSVLVAESATDVSKPIVENTEPPPVHMKSRSKRIKVDPTDSKSEKKDNASISSRSSTRRKANKQ
ncbi:antigen identified by monoclonal antibody Ki-67 [Batrachochytrium dendrobatidis]|nr:antigen identified by monoclonal antibody Ki-67 [Batrachochytrium dendrobatidis]